MLQYLDVVQALLGKEPDPEGKLLRTVERLYFHYVRRPFRRLSRSEEARIAADILAIDELLVTAPTSLASLKVRSKRFASNAFLQRLQKQPHIDRPELAQLEAEHLTPTRYYITAVFITYLIKFEYRKDRFRWLLAVILSVVATTLAALIKSFGDIYARF
jgi:hypothetical protein